MRRLILLPALLLWNLPAWSADIRLPSDSGYINVRDFGAKGDGVADDTAAIRAALTASGGDTGPTFWHDKIVYFPNGTYLISDTIEKRYPEGRYGSGMMLLGESREGVVIRLRDNADGYSNPFYAKAMIFSTAKLLDGDATSGGKDYAGKGEGNDAFMNFVENMTLDAGTGNTGAIAIDYLANNLGAIRNVTIRASGDSGTTGIAMTRKWPGPALLSHVEIQGFDIGIDVDNTEYGVTLEHITLNGQREIGIRNHHNAISARKLAITGAPRPIANLAEDGLIVLLDSLLENTTDMLPLFSSVIENAGYMNLRKVSIQGDKNNPLDLAVTEVTPPLDAAYTPYETLNTSTQSWSLAVKEPPEAFAEPAAKWASVAAFGATPGSGNDATQAIRNTLASGAAIVYFPHGIYHISDTITVPPSVRRIIGLTSTIQVMDNRASQFQREAGMFRVEGTGEALTIEKLAFDHSGKGDQVAIEHSGTRTLVLRDIIGAGVTTLKRMTSGGETFVENTCCGKIEAAGSAGLWARQLNTEGEGVRVRNQGAPMWVLGIKTEQNCTVVENSHGAITEVMGGLVYLVKPTAPPLPVFRNTDSKLYVSYVEEAFRDDAVYRTHVENVQKTVATPILAEALPARGLARIVPGLAAQ